MPGRCETIPHRIAYVASLNMPFTTRRVDSWPSLIDPSFKPATPDTCFFPCWQGHTCQRNMPVQPSRVDRSPWSVWATLWHSLEQRSSWPKLPPPAFKHAVRETCHAVVTHAGPDCRRCFSKHAFQSSRVDTWLSLVNLSHALTLAWATL